MDSVEFDAIVAGLAEAIGRLWDLLLKLISLVTGNETVTWAVVILIALWVLKKILS